MTELETIKRAKMYMDKLAIGINPLDDTPVPEEELVNHVRMAKCFCFISGILQRVIDDNERIAANSKSNKKLPLQISMEKRAQFAYSQTPISASEIAKRIYDLRENENMQKMTYSGIANWLYDMGMLELQYTEDGKTRKCPTLKGREIGITEEERNGKNGAYQIVIYNTHAQHFILDHLDDIIAAQNKKKGMQGESWTKEQDICLMELYENGMPLDEIAITMKRTSSAIRSRLKKIGRL